MFLETFAAQYHPFSSLRQCVFCTRTLVLLLKEWTKAWKNVTWDKNVSIPNPNTFNFKRSLWHINTRWERKEVKLIYWTISHMRSAKSDPWLWVSLPGNPNSTWATWVLWSLCLFCREKEPGCPFPHHTSSSLPAVITGEPLFLKQRLKINLPSETPEIEWQL